MSLSGNDRTENPADEDNDDETAQQQEQDVIPSFPMLDQVRSYLTQSELSFQVNDRRTSWLDASTYGSVIVTLTLTGHASSYKTFLDLKPQDHRLAVYIETPVKIPMAQRAAATEYLMRVNYSLALGNFELDFRDGEVRFRCVIDLEGSALSQEMVRTNVMVSAATTDRFFPGLMAVVFARQSPMTAYEACRNNNNQATTSSSSSHGNDQDGDNDDGQPPQSEPNITVAAAATTMGAQ
ncbi:hypothetical protein ACA910_003295 [Epithemia clementina (nom. ined.)]